MSSLSHLQHELVPHWVQLWITLLLFNNQFDRHPAQQIQLAREVRC